VARLGEILIANGVLTQDGLRSGLDASRRNGGRVGTWLVRLGLVNEAALLDALAQQTGCPVAKALDLATVPADVRAVIPVALARRHMVMAFNRQGRSLDVAMATPNDLVVVEELGRLTGLAIRPHVATEAALTASLALAAAAPTASSAPPPVGTPRTGGREWRQFWKLDATTPELLKAMEAPALPPAVQTAATFPFLAPIVGGTALSKTDSFEDLAESLSSATHRDQVAGLLLGALVGPGRRVALFSVMQGRIMGWAGVGLGLVEDDFRTLMLPLDRPSLFLNLVKGSDMHVGPFGGGEGNALLIDALGDPAPQEALVVPIRLRGKVASFVWIDRGDESVASLQVPDIQEIARIGGLALEILVLRQKLKAGTRLTDSGATD
jgi:hypothetical protein